MFLATTALTEFWDTRDEVLFLGRWCLRYDRRQDWAGVRGQILADPWADRRRVVEAFQYCTNIFDRVLMLLTDYLNDIHGVKRSSRYWRIVVGPWLLEYIQVLYDRYVHVRSARERDPSLSTLCLDPACYVTPKHFGDFVSWYVDDPYNLQLYSQILQTLCGTLPMRGWNKGTAPSWQRGPMKAKGLRLQLKGLVNRLAASLEPDAVIADIDAAPRDLLKLLCDGRLSVFPIAADVQEIGAYPLIGSMRSGLANVSARDPFEVVLCESMAVNFPTLYLEGYKSYRHHCLEGWRRAPRAAISANGWYVNEPFKFRAAEWAESGTRLFGVQHGGGYGMGAIVPLEWHERAITDKFFTWGWAEAENDDRLRNLPYPRLCGLLKKTRARGASSAGLLLITSAFSRYSGRFQTIPIGSRVEQYLDDRAIFLQSLSGRGLAEASVRLHPTDYSGSSAKERLQQACPDVKLDDTAAPATTSLTRCRLAVFDNPGTAYLEGLVLNVPSILFWRPELFEGRPSAESYLRQLRNALILHDDPKTAAAHASAVYDDPWRWWGSEEVQSARCRFVDRYAKVSRGWVADWVNVLRSV